MTTGFDCQQFLQGLQNRNNEAGRLGRENRRESKNEADRLRYHANSAELATLKQSVADHEELSVEKQARLDDLQRRLKRQKRHEEAIDQEHPMIKLLVNSGRNTCYLKLMQLILNGTVNKLLTSYFVPGQTMKLSDTFIKSVDGCEEVSRFLIISCLDHHIPELSKMKNSISTRQPLSKDNSIHAQQIILRLCPPNPGLTEVSV